jgi:hypothetical protein
VAAKAEEIHMIAKAPRIMRQGDQRRVKALIDQELH